MIIDREDRAVFTHELVNRRRGGRPRAVVPRVITSVRLPEPVFDALCRVAHRRDQSLHATMISMLETFATQGGPHGFQ